MPNEDYYAILGIDRNASAEDIKRAFRKKASELHPDRNKDPKAPDMFKKVNEAYQVLSNPQKKQMYDQFGSAAVDGNGFGNGGGGGFQFDFSDLFGDGLDSIFGDSPFGDLFGRKNNRNTSDEYNLYLKILVDLIDIINGNEKEIYFEKNEYCPVCKGKGGTKVETCPTCKGRGKVSQITRSVFGNIQVLKECLECHGTGKKIIEKCSNCNGTSIIKTTKTLKIKIPRGIESGVNLRFKSEGNAVPFQNRYGDLFIQIDVKNNNNFIRDGDNLIYSLEISFYSLVLGDEIEINTLEGVEKLHLSPGHPVDQKIVLQNKGIPNFNTGKRGSLIIILKPIVPKDLTNEEYQLYKQLKEISQRTK